MGLEADFGVSWPKRDSLSMGCSGHSCRLCRMWWCARPTVGMGAKVSTDHGMIRSVALSPVPLSSHDSFAIC
jgi:hypothetical protein